MSVQTEKKFESTQPRTAPAAISLQLTHQTLREAFADWSSWTQGPANASQNAQIHGPTLSSRVTNTPISLDRRNPYQPTTNTAHLLPDISDIAQDRQNLTLNAHMQDNAYITGGLVWGKL